MIIKAVKRVLFSAALLSAALFFVATPVIAQTITQGYFVDESSVSIQNGMVVALKDGDSTKIEPINNSQATRAHGVVVGTGDSAFVLSEENQKVYVASSGKFSVLVSDQNGTIRQGDFISLSSVTGIAMKSDEFQEIVLGKAIDAYDGSVGKISEATIKDAQGNDKLLKIGRIRVDIQIMRNPILKSTASLPSFLKDASEYVAGKPVNPIRVYISLAVIIAAASVSGALIYSGVRAGMIAIGRNPLSKKSIIRGIIQVIIVAIIIFIIGIFGVYLLLKL